MKTDTIPSTDADEVLVSQSLGGNREAFGVIVQRYQSLVCSLAYNATGSLSRSEDLAQETFVAAWRQLAGLREPSKLRSWLCRIAHNITCDALKKEGRSPLSASDPIGAADESATGELSPPDQAITREEEAIMWRSLERIPDSYRQPLILFYREQHSVARVAEALELSEDAVKQRLTRGRRLLQKEVQMFVEGALERSAPGASFTQGVLLALPGMTATTTSLLASATAKGVAGGLLKVFGAVSLVFVGNYAGYRAGLALAQSEPERDFIKRFYSRLLAACLGYSFLLLLTIFVGINYAKAHRLLFDGLVVLVATGSLVSFTLFAFWSWRARGQLMAQQKTEDLAKYSAPAWEYCSRARFLGWPLVHIRFGRRGPIKTRVVKAWIAVGDCAVGGLFAFGGMALAPLSIGGCAIGLIPWGGMAFGFLAAGGFAVGGWSVGGLALGWKALGGGAIAWKAASGALAMAHDFAVGAIAQAANANNTPAVDYVRSSRFFRAGTVFCRYAWWINLLWVVPLIFFWKAVSRANSLKKTGAMH